MIIWRGKGEASIFGEHEAAGASLQEALKRKKWL